MKKYIYIFAIAVISISLFSCGKKETAETFTIEHLIGEVYITDIEGHVRKPAKVGDQIHAGQRIITGSKSEAVLSSGDEFIKIKQRTDISVRKSLSYGNDKARDTELHIKEGTLYAKTGTEKFKTNNFTVDSSSASASTKGALFRLRDRDGVTSIDNFEGNIDLSDKKNPAGRISLSSGEKIIAGKGPEPVKTKITAQNPEKDFYKNFAKDGSKEKLDRMAKYQPEYDDIIEPKPRKKTAPQSDLSDMKPDVDVPKVK